MLLVRTTVLVVCTIFGHVGLHMYKNDNRFFFRQWSQNIPYGDTVYMYVPWFIAPLNAKIAKTQCHIERQKLDVVQERCLLILAVGCSVLSSPP